MPEAEEELPLLTHPKAQALLVDNEESLSNAVDELSRLSGPVAIDAERASGYKYFPRAYLIQVYKAGGAIYLIDPAAFGAERIGVFASLASVLASDEWILHAATQDLPCLAELGLVPKRLFDTELASRILGLERVGLGSICESVLGFRLAKEHSAVDWSIRPLKQEWLNYAALDVDVLHSLREVILQKLVEAKKESWAFEEFANLVNFRPKSRDAEKWRGLSGLHALKDRKKLAIAKALWCARDELAQKLDVSPGRLLPDASIIEASNQNPKTRSELLANRNFSGRASRSYSDLWWRAIEEGNQSTDLPDLKVASGAIPHHRFWKQKFPEAAERLAKARQTIQRISEEHSLPSENILSPDVLRQICWKQDLDDKNEISKELTNLGARSWQVTLLADELAEAFTVLPEPEENSNHPG